jgi:hypothetical protein
MTHLKMIAAAATVVGGLGLTAASAAPLAPIAADTVAGATHVTDVAFGCGPGFVPRRFGPGCRPAFRGYGYGPRRFYGGPRRFYGGPRRFYR